MSRSSIFDCFVRAFKRKRTDRQKGLLVESQDMEGVDFDMKDLTPMLSRFMDASGKIDPSRAPPDMTASFHNTAETPQKSHISVLGVAESVQKAEGGGLMWCTGSPRTSERLPAGATAGKEYSSHHPEARVLPKMPLSSCVVLRSLLSTAGAHLTSSYLHKPPAPPSWHAC